jgi:hypothetical protein
MSRVGPRLAALAMAVTALAGAAAALTQTPAEAQFTPLARSALVSVEAAVLAPDTLTLRIRHTPSGTNVVSAQLQVAAQGRSLPVTANADGTWTVALKDLNGKPPGKLDLLVTHDGIRELVSGSAAPPAAGTASGAAAGLLHNHKQLAWWILNVAIVLIAAVAISRRMS